jgi:phosphoribosylaminoimidazole (AIR) synthetase
MNYADAGVSLARADEAMVGVKKSVRSTFNAGVLGDVGNFGGLLLKWLTSPGCSCLRFPILLVVL